jgi:hypothetical protein
MTTQYGNAGTPAQVAGGDLKYEIAAHINGNKLLQAISQLLGISNKFNVTNICHLEVKPLLKILKNLSVTDISSMSLTCRHLKSQLNSDSVYKYLYLRDSKAIGKYPANYRLIK